VSKGSTESASSHPRDDLRVIIPSTSQRDGVSHVSISPVSSVYRYPATFLSFYYLFLIFFLFSLY
jgi:hypothetical protein